MKGWSSTQSGARTAFPLPMGLSWLRRSPLRRVLLPWAIALGLMAACPASARAQSQRTSLSELAAAVADGLKGSTPALVAVGSITTRGLELPEAQRTQLDERIRTVVASAVPTPYGRVTSVASASEARTLARRADVPLVYLSPALDGGSLRLSVDRIEWPTNFWAQVANPEGTVVRHLAVSVPVDAEVRRYLPPAPGLFTTRRRFDSPVSAPLALACGDTDGDGGQELVIVGRRKVAIGRFTQDSFAALWTADWETLSPISDHPLRAPLASAAIQAGVVWIGSSDRQNHVRLEANQDGGWTSQLGPRAYPVGPDRCLALSSAGLLPMPQPCSEVADVPRQDDQASLDGWASSSISDARGIPRVVTAQLGIGSQLVELHVESPVQAAQLVKVERTGSQFFVADVTGNGRIELVSSQAGYEPGEDLLRVHRLGEGAPELLASRTSSPIDALTACPFHGKNPLTIVVASGNQLEVFP